ncbi:hypothetical protein OIU76_012637 [Salix suchowensis]|nr:methyltransferase protein [Salix suchowensis]KAJ6325595.1 hypothetical protein OIU76_012637 [Salix suchowensis]KAJ6325596.1 hypothetical protein OIU76_012637 [Salix suchowensis]
MPNSMALDIKSFETIIPSRFLSFTIPNPALPTHLLRVAVLDNPIQLNESPQVAALFVPQNREPDWIFSTESGHLQLLLSSPGISRLILIGSNPISGSDSSPLTYHKRDNAQYVKSLENSVKPLFFALSPKVSFQDGIFDVPILDYEDNLICSVVLERCVGVFVCEMLVEDIEIESDSELREFRRRLRFKRMPNLVQTEIRIVPQKVFELDRVKIGGEVKFEPDTKVLVHSYLIPMVASLYLIGSCIEDRFRKGLKPKALCLGVGGGALLSFLRTELGFEVFGVEMDEEVLRVARQYFGLEDCEIHVSVGDAIEYVEKLAGRDRVLVSGEDNGDFYLNHANGFGAKFDVIMVDLDSCDARNGVIAPPLEFVKKHILSAARSVLSDFGIFVMNVIPPTRLFYDTLIHEFQEIFHELYEIDVGNGENFVLIAKVSPVTSPLGECENSFLQKLRIAIPGRYLDSIRKI